MSPLVHWAVELLRFLLHGSGLLQPEARAAAVGHPLLFVAVLSAPASPARTHQTLSTLLPVLHHRQTPRSGCHCDTGSSVHYVVPLLLLIAAILATPPSR